MLTCQMSVGEANVAVMKNAWMNSWYMTWRRKMEDIVRLPSYQCIYGDKVKRGTMQTLPKTQR